MSGKIWIAAALILLGAVPPVWGATSWFTRDNSTKIVYDVLGPETAQQVLFIHCWGCSRDFWAAQVAELAKEFRVAAVDLPGHGESRVKGVEFGFDETVEILAAAVEEAGLERFVVVGHSMGGPLALRLAARLPGRVQAIVCVDTLQNLEFKIKSTGFTMKEEGFEEQVRLLIPRLVHPASSEDVTRRVISQVLATDRRVLLSLWRDYENADFAAMMRKAGVPVRCINAVAYGETGSATEIEINRKYGDYDAVFMENVGHYPMLEKPAEFTRLLRRTILRAVQPDHA